MGIIKLEGVSGNNIMALQEALQKDQEEKMKNFSSGTGLLAGNFADAERSPSRYVQASKDALQVSTMAKFQAQSRTSALLSDIVGTGDYNTQAKANAKVQKQEDAEMNSVLEEQMKQLQEALKKAEKKRQAEEAAARAQAEGKTQVVVDAETGEISTVTPESAGTEMALTPAETTQITSSQTSATQLPTPADTGADVSVDVSVEALPAASEPAAFTEAPSAPRSAPEAGGSIDVVV